MCAGDGVLSCALGAGRIPVSGEDADFPVLFLNSVRRLNFHPSNRHENSLFR
jgi:hypothetical protein